MKKNMVMLIVLCGLLLVAGGCCPGKKGYVAFSFGLSKFDEGEYKAAIKYFTIAMNTGFEDKAEAYTQRGLAKWRMNDTLGAVEDYTKAFEENSEELTPVFYRGSIRYIMGDYEAALRDYLMLLEWDNNYEENRLEFDTNIGTLYLRIEKADSAMIWFSDAIENSKHPENIFQNKKFKDWLDDTSDEELKTEIQKKLSDMIASKDENTPKDSTEIEKH